MTPNYNQHIHCYSNTLFLNFDVFKHAQIFHLLLPDELLNYFLVY